MSRLISFEIAFAAHHRAVSGLKVRSNAGYSPGPSNSHHQTQARTYAENLVAAGLFLFAQTAQGSSGYPFNLEVRGIHCQLPMMGKGLTVAPLVTAEELD